MKLWDEKIASTFSKVDELVQKDVHQTGETIEYVYRKLDLEGATNDFWKTTYFESISEEEFNRMDHKDHVNIESITIHKSNAGLWLKGIDVQLTDNDPSLGLNRQIISRGRIEVEGDDTKMNLYDYNPKKIELEQFEEDGFPSGMQFFADDSVDQPELGVLAREIVNSHQS